MTDLVVLGTGRLAPPKEACTRVTSLTTCGARQSSSPCSSSAGNSIVLNSELEASNIPIFAPFPAYFHGAVIGKRDILDAKPPQQIALMRSDA